MLSRLCSQLLGGLWIANLTSDLQAEFCLGAEIGRITHNVAPDARLFLLVREHYAVLVPI